MKNVVSTALAALVLVAASVTGTPSAQPAATGDALQAQAERVRSALLTGTPDEFFNAIAPWLQGRVRLNQEDTVEQLTNLRDKSPGFAEDFKKELEEHLYGQGGMDPDRQSGIKTLDDVINARPALVFAVRYGFFRVRAENMKTRVSKRWHLVDRSVGSASQGRLNQQVGAVRFGSAGHHDMIEVRCVAEGTQWQVVDVRVNMGALELDFEGCPALNNPIDDAVEWRSQIAEIREEGEQMLQAYKNQTRVYFAKHGKAPATLVADCGADAEDLEGVFFTLRDKVYKKPDTERSALVVNPMDDSFGWGAIYYNYADGNSDLKWYANSADLEADLKAFETAK